MNKAILIFLFACYVIPTTAFTQVRKIPSSVTNAFSEKYLEANDLEWKDKLSFFVADFTMGNETMEARFSSKGDWIQTETAIPENELPDAVKDGYEKSKYTEWKIVNLYRVELPGDELQYRLQVAKSDIRKKNLLFNKEGRLLKDKITL